MSTDAAGFTSAGSPWWAKLLDRFGVPTVMLIAIMWAGWIALGWIAEQIVLPLTQSHIALLASVQQSNSDLTQVLKEIATTNHAILKQSQNNAALMDSLLSDQALMAEELIREMFGEVAVQHHNMDKQLAQVRQYIEANFGNMIKRAYEHATEHIEQNASDSNQIKRN